MRKNWDRRIFHLLIIIADFLFVFVLFSVVFMCCIPQAGSVLIQSNEQLYSSFFQFIFFWPFPFQSHTCDICGFAASHCFTLAVNCGEHFQWAALETKTMLLWYLLNWETCFQRIICVRGAKTISSTRSICFPLGLNWKRFVSTTSVLWFHSNAF